MEFAGFHDAVDDTVSKRAIVGLTSEGDFAPDYQWSELTLGAIVVELNIGVRDETDQIVAVLDDSS